VDVAHKARPAPKSDDHLAQGQAVVDRRSTRADSTSKSGARFVRDIAKLRRPIPLKNTGHGSGAGIAGYKLAGVAEA